MTTAMATLLTPMNERMADWGIVWACWQHVWDAINHFFSAHTPNERDMKSGMRLQTSHCLQTLQPAICFVILVILKILPTFICVPFNFKYIVLSHIQFSHVWRPNKWVVWECRVLLSCHIYIYSQLSFIIAGISIVVAGPNMRYHTQIPMAERIKIRTACRCDLFNDIVSRSILWISNCCLLWWQ